MEKDDKQFTELFDAMKKIFPELFDNPNVDEKKGEDKQNIMDMNTFIRGHGKQEK